MEIASGDKSKQTYVVRNICHSFEGCLEGS